MPQRNNNTATAAAATGGTEGPKSLESLLSTYRVNRSRAFAYFHPRQYVTHYLHVRRDQLARNVLRVLASSPATTTTSSLPSPSRSDISPDVLLAATSNGTIDRKSTALATALASKVAQWSRDRAGCNTKELRANPALLRDVISVLESLVYLLFDEPMTTENSTSPKLMLLPLDPSVKSAIAPTVSALIAFAARAALFGYSPKSGSHVPCVYYQHSKLHDIVAGSPATSAAAANAAQKGKPLRNDDDDDSATSESGGDDDEKDDDAQQKQEDSGSSSSSSMNQSLSNPRSEVDVRTAAIFLICGLVQIYPDAVFPLWATLFPDGTDATEMASRSTLLSPMLFDDFRVRAAAINAVVAVVTSVPQTLAVVPLEVRSSAPRITSRLAASRQGSSAAAAAAPAAVANAFQSDISRVAFVLTQVYRTIITALRVQHEQAESARKTILELVAGTNIPATRRGVASRQQVSGCGVPAEDSKDMASHPFDSQKLLLLTEASVAHQFSSALRMLLTTALSSLSAVVPYQRAPSVAKLMFGALEEMPRILVSPIEAGADMARQEGGAHHDQSLSAALFLVATVANSAGSRSIVRVFYAAPAGRQILDACFSVLPHIDAWKVVSSLARHHPDALRGRSWSHIFGVAKDMFRVASAALVSNSNNRKGAMAAAAAAASGVSMVTAHPIFRRIPYQANLECLRAFVYFIGTRALPWETPLRSKQGIFLNLSSSTKSGGHNAVSTRLRKTIGSGLASNVVPLGDSSDEREMADHRATHSEISDILRCVALPAVRSHIDNVRCVAYRILAAIPDSFLAASKDDEQQESSSIYFSEKEKEALCALLLDKCRAEIDEARLEVLSAAFCWISHVPSLAKRIFCRLSRLVCDELLGKADLLAMEGRTRACQVMEALAKSLVTTLSESEEIGAECSRILHASWRVIQFHQQKQQQQQQSNSGIRNNTNNSIPSSLTAAVVEASTMQMACCLRSCASAVCALPHEYLFMEFGPNQDDVVSWLFALLRRRSDAILLLPAKECQEAKETAAGSETRTSLRLVDAYVLIAVIESFGKLCSAQAVAECDPEGAQVAVADCLARSLNLFSAAPQLSRETYAVAGAALRALAKIAREPDADLAAEMLLSPPSSSSSSQQHAAGNSHRDDEDGDEIDDGKSSSIRYRRQYSLLYSALDALRRSSNDADVARSGLQEDFNRACSAMIVAVMPLLKSMPREVKDAVRREFDDLMYSMPVIDRLFAEG